ncbi:hypothetical protein, partial [Streptomyces griseiscabiei]
MQGADAPVSGEVVDLGGAAEAVGHDDRRRVLVDVVEARLQGQAGDGHRGVVVLFLEAEVAGESAAALGLVDLPYAEATEQVTGVAALEGGVLVAVGLQDDVVRQLRWRPAGGGEVGEG